MRVPLLNSRSAPNLWLEIDNRIIIVRADGYLGAVLGVEILLTFKKRARCIDSKTNEI
jgi:hypothetical protein